MTDILNNKEIKKLNEKLKKASQIRDQAKKNLMITLFISKALNSINIHPILVGGGAVEFYTKGSYTTGDIDLIAPGGKDVKIILKRLGFKKFGKNWINDELEIFLEFPSSSLEVDEKYIEIEIGKERIRIVSLEDLIIDRLSAYKWWGSTVDGVNTLLLLESKIYYNKNIVIKKAKKADVIDAYNGIRKILKEIKKGTFSKDTAMSKLEDLLRRITK